MVDTVVPAVPQRTLDLLRLAEEHITQAQYEGSHVRRQEPAPALGSPWSTPDLPLDVQQALTVAQQSVSAAIAQAERHRARLAQQAQRS